tara:strand:- start:845 stop:1792 length:948 start_codon:yes stop_codon:yes gene_type:complete
MMERDFIAQKTKEFHIKKYLETKLSNVGLSQIRLKKIPLGEKIIIHTSRPSLVVGSKGANIKDLTKYLKKQFKLENPQIEIIEIKDIFLDANVVAERIAFSLERFGSARFKGVGHKTIENVMKAGALGIEILISGKIPGARAKSWRFYQGYLKKCGDISITGVSKAKKVAALKSGIIGIKVSIMPPDIKLPDKIKILEEPTEEVVEEVEDKKGKKKPAKKEAKTKKAAKKTKKDKSVKVVEEKVEKIEEAEKVKEETENMAEEKVEDKKVEEESPVIEETEEPASEKADTSEEEIPPAEPEEAPATVEPEKNEDN